MTKLLTACLFLLISTGINALAANNDLPPVQTVVRIGNLEDVRQIHGFKTIEVESCDTEFNVSRSDCFGTLKATDSLGKIHFRKLKSSTWYFIRSVIDGLQRGTTEIKTTKDEATCRMMPQETPVVCVLQTTYREDNSQTQKMVVVLAKQSCSDVERIALADARETQNAAAVQSMLIMLTSELFGS